MNPCILVFGMPRSGTTWIGKLFDSHPDTLYRHEPDSVRVLSVPLFPEKRDAHRYSDELKQFVAALPWLRGSKVVGKQPLFPKSYQSTGALLAYRASAAGAKAVGRVWREFPCLYRPTAEGHGCTRLVWKSIESPGRLGVCVEALPGARAIYLLRHPCGYVASMLRGERARRFGDTKPSVNSIWLMKELLEAGTGKLYGLDPGALRQLTPVERLTWLWVLTQERVLADVADDRRVLTVRYEDVCDEPLAMTRRMFDFIGLGWHPQSQAFVERSTQPNRAGYYDIFRNPQTAARSWRSELPQATIDRVLGILRTSRLREFYDDAVDTPGQPAESIA